MSAGFVGLQWGVFVDNLGPGFEEDYHFFKVFSVFFPAVSSSSGNTHHSTPVLQYSTVRRIARASDLTQHPLPPASVSCTSTVECIRVQWSTVRRVARASEHCESI